MNAQAHSEGASIDPVVVQRAAEWMARLWSGDVSASDRAACEAWRTAHPDHERAWARLQGVEDKLQRVRHTAARRALVDQPTDVSASRRDVLRLLGITLAIGGTTYTMRKTDLWQFTVSDYTTKTGEMREVGLPDGTRVLLNTASAVDVRFNDRERRVILRAGEILITTAADPAAVHRPFVVECQQGTVEALGTRFTVRQDRDTSRVAVYQGAVEVRPVHAAGPALRLDAGQGAVFSGDRVQNPVSLPESTVAWSQGLLVAEHLRVADFLAELGRYRSGVLHCGADAADLQVTGVFSLRDTDRALANLTLALPVEVRYRTRYWVTVHLR